MTDSTAAAPRTITILQPDADVPSDRIGPWLDDGGIDVRTVRLWRDPLPAIGDCGEGIILLGGRASAVDREAYPWLDDLHLLMRAAVGAGLPLLGICLGHQILADAFGGEVRVGHPSAGEEGHRIVELDDAAVSDPVFSSFGATMSVAESHHDAVTRLPEGAVLLASTPACPIQAFRLGSAVGVQFHPEASPELVAEWAASEGGDAAAVEAEMRVVDDAVSRAGRAVVLGFAGVAAVAS